MKIVYILSSTNVFGGASKAIVSLLKGFVAKGVEPIVVLPGTDGLYEELQRIGLCVIYAPMRLSVYPRHSTLKGCLLFVPRLLYWRLLNVYSYIKLSKLLKKEHVDLIHTNVSVMDIGYRLAKRLHVPHVFHIREYADKDFNLHYFPSKKYFQDIFTCSDCYTICITKDVQKYHGLDRIKSSYVVYDGVCDLSSLVIGKAKKRYFLYAGRIQPSKGLLSLLRAYHRYIEAVNAIEVVPLLVAGEVSDNVYYSQIKSFVEQNSMSTNVSFLGPRGDLAELMQHALAIVIPSVFEGFGFCMTEAMFNGCLVIGHNTGGTKEQFDNGKQFTGKEIGLRYDTEEQLTGHLIDVAKGKPDVYADMIERASLVVGKLYSTKVCVENVYNLYKKILDEKCC